MIEINEIPDIIEFNIQFDILPSKTIELLEVEECMNVPDEIKDYYAQIEKDIILDKKNYIG